jgi:alginate O-acetyltransferase complex protein AlgI
VIKTRDGTMLFSSSTFALFFLITFAIYYLPFLRRHQVVILLIASATFYSWAAPLLLILLTISVLLNAFVSYKVHHSQERKQFLWALSGVVINLSILAYFKYAKLFAGMIGELFNTRGSDAIQFLLLTPLPIGISFYTFEGISLLVDVIRMQKGKKEEANRIVAKSFLEHLRNTALFVTFFPHLIAGPILKARHYYPQIGSKLFSAIDWEFAFKTLVVGYFLKMVIADNLSAHTIWLSDPYYKTLSTATGITLLFGYSMQIFSDFAGYSLIAIGLGALFGYELPPNFNFPYISRSIAEFWRRWHISLSTWLRDYLYIPLGGSKKGPRRTYINLALVMVLGGLWHGAAWSYAVWGAYHGIGLAIERFFTKEERPEPPAWVSGLKMLGVFLFVSVGWLLFRMPNFNEVIGFVQAMSRNQSLPNDRLAMAVVFLFSTPVIVYHLLNIESVQKKRITLAQTSPLYRKIVVFTYGLLVASLVLNYGSSADFIYFQF